MSRLLRDATKANAAGRTVSPVPDLNKMDDFDDLYELPSKPVQPQANVMPQRSTVQKTFDDIPFDAKAFSKDFFASLEDFANLRKAIPDDLNSFADCDRFLEGCLPEIRLEIRLETESLNQQLHETLSKIRQLEFSAENSVKMQKDRGLVYGILFDRKDLQNKVAILTEKKIRLFDLKERLDCFEMFAELSRDMGTYQKVATSFLNEHKVYFPEDDLDTKVKMGCVYSKTHAVSHGFKIDKEPIHDYHLVELPQNDSKLKDQIDAEYRELLRKTMY